MADPGEQRPAGGISGALSQLAVGFIALLHTRFELLTVEFEEERERAKDLVVLTVIATIMLPLTVITSYYGMNFRMPEFAWTWGWLYALGLLIATAVGTWWYLRRRRWF